MKYCPLCVAEYREGVEQCATCGATLVASLHADQVRANPPRLLWMGRDSVEFDLVACALRDAQIPGHTEEGLGGLVGNLLKSISKIHVLQSDFSRSLTIASDAIAHRANGFGKTQTCFACAADCSAALASCPKCRTVLVVERTQESETAAPQAAPDSGVLKYCPICGAEYRAQHERCTICGVDLVPEESRGRPLTEKERNERIEIVWRGGDPLAVSEVVNRLRDAGIRHHMHATSDHLVFEMGMPRPKYLVRVFASDIPKAKELLAGITESLPFGLSYTPHADAEPLALQVRTTENWNPAAAMTEVWSGDDAALANLLVDCLCENRIGVRRAGREPGTQRLFVMPAYESAAREIVREVREGTPPV